MKKNFWALFVSCPFVLMAQGVGINTDGSAPNASSILDINSTTQGILIPRMTAAQIAAIDPLPAAAQGLMIYQTDGVQGIYYNTSTTTTPNYVYVLNSATGGWTTTGNAGTVAGTNFLGTTDAIDLVFKTTGVERLRIASDGVFTITNATATVKPFIIKAAASQSANLTEWQNSSGTAVALVGPDGAVGIGATPTSRFHVVNATTSTCAIFNQSNSTGQPAIAQFIGSGTTTMTWGGLLLTTSSGGMTATSATTGGFFPNDGEPRINIQNNITNAEFTIVTNNTGNSATSEILRVNEDGELIMNTAGAMATASDLLQIKASASHTGNLTEWQNSSGTNLSVVNASGRFGIGGAANANAMLDITGTDAMVLPIGTTAQRPTAENGMLRYNSDNSAIEMYNGSWGSLLSTNTTWTHTGNSGLTAGTHFIGMTDQEDLVFKTGGTERMRITSTDATAAGNVGIGTASPGNAKLYLNSSSAVNANTYGLVVTHSQTTASGSTAKAMDYTASFTAGSGTQQGLNAIDGTVNVSAGGTVNYAKAFGCWGVIEGNVGEYKGVDISDVGGSGTITTNHGLYISNITRGTTDWAIYSAGGNSYHVGKIGVNMSPTYQLDVTGSVSYTSGASDNYTITSAFSNGDGSAANYSIRANNGMMATRFQTTSDARIKNIFAASDNKKDLDLLNRIKIVDYKMKDTIAEGSQMHKKVIAQQVKEVMPQLISVSKGAYLPDVYKMATEVEKTDCDYICLSVENNLQQGETVNLAKGSTRIDATVMEAEPGYIIVGNMHHPIDETDKVFVFGRKVDDLLTVDYDGLTTLNISATQELSRKVDELEKKVKELQEENYRILSSSNEMTKRLEAIERKLFSEVTSFPKNNYSETGSTLK